MTTRARVAPVALLACAVIALGFAGCWKTKRNPLYCDDTTTCTEPSHLYCDKTTHTCEASPLDGSMMDGGGDLGTACTSNASCTTASAPICDTTMKTCRGCITGSTDCSFFTGRNVCNNGACVECASKADCANQNKTCNLSMLTCAPCNANADCETGVCRADQSCATVGDIVYVNNSTCTAGPTHMGTIGDPYCQVNEAFASELSTIFVYGSATNYDSITFTAAGTKSIVGPGKTATPQATFLSTTASGVTLNLTSGTASLSLAGVTLTGSNSGAGAPSASCTASPGATASLSIARALLVNSGGDGLDSTNCNITLDANEITSNHGGGVNVSKGTYTITNNIIALNGNLGTGNPGFTTDTTANGSFAFNTVTKNSASGAGGIDCSSTSHAITASIVDGNTTAAGTQFANACTFTNVVVGTADTTTAPGVTKLDPAFISTSNFRLDMTGGNAATNNACCVDKLTSGPTHDVDQTARPIRANWDIGAFEAP